MKRLVKLGRLATGRLHYVVTWNHARCARCHCTSKNKKVVVGTMNPKAGCAGSILNLLQMEEFNHQVELTTGIMEKSVPIFTKILRELRIRNKGKA